MNKDTSTGHPEELGGAYALNALSQDDIALYEQYLDQSEQARIEAEELSDTAVALGLATIPVQPSAALKASLMDLIKTTPQLAPLGGPAQAAHQAPQPTDAPAPVTPLTLVPANPATPDAPRSRREARTESSTTATPTEPATPGPIEASAGEPDAGLLAERRPASTGTGAQAAPLRSGAEARAQARWFQRPARLLVAASAAVALFVGGTVIGGALNDNQFVEQQAASLAQINAAPDSQRASTTTGDGQEATLVWSNTLGISAVLVDELPALPSDQDYQLWYINGDGPLSAGTFDSTGEGTVWRVLDGTMHAGDAVGVTVEPNGGSDAPTTDPIVAFQS
ncbi:hypothetical protein D6T64_17895 [Cryobacterium melibiosiphilum]|uniref:Regulator of SigK n=1 Tax=Cryobacterium melibiosiphilum TaxID=995039 RepID=A0A3A5MM63_9MICO|nr:anti-sigma factor [Cryobacterium melibiosiphilum]RJT86142.1 hypothetical protein D6T64_17895 [Cryobacterium melibiosiphilum]